MEYPYVTYEKLGEDGKVKRLPVNDNDGKITGRIVMNLKAWMDENPEERIRLGWTKHIHNDPRAVEYDRQRQYTTKEVVQVDEWTVEDVYHVLDKSEEMMRLHELIGWAEGVSIIGDFDDDDGVITV